MLFERRAYTLRPENAAMFWQLQEKWNTPAQIPGLLARNVGYFQTLAGPADQIVHLYRFDSFDDWKTRLFGVYTADRAEYFKAARNLLLAQENMFLALAPIPGLNPIWSEERDWLPGSPFFAGVENRKGICVVEKTLDFIPGGLPIYWDAFKELDLTSGSRMAAHLIACFYTLVGVQHRVIHYQWFSNETDARDYQMEMEGSLQWQRFADSYRHIVARNHVAYLRPSPVNWMQSLFTHVGPY